MSINGSLLPNGRKVYFLANGSINAGGFVGFYQPGGLTPATTYQNPALSTPNPQTGPVSSVPLDTAGTCAAWGTGEFREIVYDSVGNTISDSETFGDIPTVNTNGALTTFLTDILANGFVSGDFQQLIAVSGTFYTAIPVATFLSSYGQGVYLVGTFCENSTAEVAVLTSPTSVGPPVIGRAVLLAGTNITTQIDGSGNFQVKQTNGTNQVITVVWIRIGNAVIF